MASTETSSVGGRRVLVWRARSASDSHSSNAAQLLDSRPAYDDREVRVLFTGTISRKMLLGVSLVMGMLLILSFSGISGLYSFRRVIRELDYDITEAPQKADLVAASSALHEPLYLSVSNDARAGLLQKYFGGLLEQAKRQLAEFRRRSDNLP